jgi:hypothetical protein
MHLPDHPKWPSILGINHGKCVYFIVINVFISRTVTFFCKNSLDKEQNKKDFKWRDDLLISLTQKVIWFNKVCHNPHEKIMKCEKMVVIKTKKKNKGKTLDPYIHGRVL